MAVCSSRSTETATQNHDGCSHERDQDNVTAKRSKAFDERNARNHEVASSILSELGSKILPMRVEITINAGSSHSQRDQQRVELLRKDACVQQLHGQSASAAATA